MSYPNANSAIWNTYSHRNHHQHNHHHHRLYCTCTTPNQNAPLPPSSPTVSYQNLPPRPADSKTGCSFSSVLHLLAVTFALCRRSVLGRPALPALPDRAADERLLQTRDCCRPATYFWSLPYNPLPRSLLCKNPLGKEASPRGLYIRHFCHIWHSGFGPNLDQFWSKQNIKCFPSKWFSSLTWCFYWHITLRLWCILYP